MKRFVLLFLTSLALVSCVEYQESASLRSDGSGQFAIRLGILDDTIESTDLSLKDSIAKLPGIQIDSLSSVSGEGQTTLIARVSFESLDALNGLGAHMAQNVIGEFAQKDSAGLRVLTRKIPVVLGLAPDYSLQVPGRVVDADSLALDQGFGAGFVRWLVPPEALARPLEFRVVYVPERAAVQTWMVVALGAGFVVLLFAVLVLIGRLRRLSWTVKALQAEEEQQGQ
jgi:hypothetical protein